MTSSDCVKNGQTIFNNGRIKDQHELLRTINLASTLRSGTAAPLDIIHVGDFRLMMQYCACESLDGKQHGGESASNGAAVHSTEPYTKTRIS